MGSMRKSRLSHYKQDRLLEHFVSGSTALTAARLCGVNRKTAAFFFRRLRELIALELEAESEAMFGGERVRDYYESMGWKHVAGGRYSDLNETIPDGKKPGDEQSEYHIPGPGRAFKVDSRRGGRFSDLTFETPDGKTVHIQSVDVDTNGKPTKRELDAAESIRRAVENANIILISKGAQLGRNKRSHR